MLTDSPEVIEEDYLCYTTCFDTRGRKLKELFWTKVDRK